MTNILNSPRKVLLSVILLLLMGGGLRAQQVIPVSVREIAPDYGIQPLFLDDTIHLVNYLNSLNLDSHTLADTCVSINARLMALGNNLQYDYRRNNDTLWIDGSHFIEDYDHYANRIEYTSQFILQQIHNYIENDHIRQDNEQQNILKVRKDSIFRQHRTIVNACEGIGVSDKDRKHELRDIYYAYLSVYNRYDFSMRRNDEEYSHGLLQFSQFQQHLIENLLGSNNYTAKINNFSNTLKLRCGHPHNDVLRSYQRVFRKTSNPVRFSTLKEYYSYIETQQEIIDIQNCYLTVVDLREQIDATNKRIVTLYSPMDHEAAKTYQDVAATINIVPAFTTLADADLFISDLEEFVNVQECYIQDYNRLSAVQRHGDSIIRCTALHYSDIAKAYKKASTVNSMSPKYKTLDDAARFRQEIERFETIQRQFDSVIILRQDIDDATDTISKNWMSHLIIYNGYQSIRKQYLLTPTFIDIEGGVECIDKLLYFSNIQNKCLDAIDYLREYKDLNSQILSATSNYRNIRKAYNKLEEHFLTIKAINHLSELDLYYQQLADFVIFQQDLLQICTSDKAIEVDVRIKGAKDINKILTILGIK